MEYIAYLCINLSSGEVREVHTDKKSAERQAKAMVRQGYSWVVQKAKITYLPN